MNDKVKKIYKNKNGGIKIVFEDGRSMHSLEDNPSNEYMKELIKKYKKKNTITEEPFAENLLSAKQKMYQEIRFKGQNIFNKIFSDIDYSATSINKYKSDIRKKIKDHKKNIDSLTTIKNIENYIADWPPLPKKIL